jgi:hypothetical protein
MVSASTLADARGLVLLRDRPSLSWEELGKKDQFSNDACLKFLAEVTHNLLESIRQLDDVLGDYVSHHHSPSDIRFFYNTLLSGYCEEIGSFLDCPSQRTRASINIGDDSWKHVMSFLDGDDLVCMKEISRKFQKLCKTTLLNSVSLNSNACTELPLGVALRDTYFSTVPLTSQDYLSTHSVQFECMCIRHPEQLVFDQLVHLKHFKAILVSCVTPKPADFTWFSKLVHLRSSALLSLELDLLNVSPEQYVFLTQISQLRKLQKLDLKLLNSGAPHQVELTLLNSVPASLEIFSLNLNGLEDSHPFIISASSLPFEQLKSLTINGCGFSSGFWKEMCNRLSACKSLEVTIGCIEPPNHLKDFLGSNVCNELEELTLKKRQSSSWTDIFLNHSFEAAGDRLINLKSMNFGCDSTLPVGVFRQIVAEARNLNHICFNGSFLNIPLCADQQTVDKQNVGYAPMHELEHLIPNNKITSVKVNYESVVRRPLKLIQNPNPGLYSRQIREFHLAFPVLQKFRFDLGGDRHIFEEDEFDEDTYGDVSLSGYLLVWKHNASLAKFSKQFQELLQSTQLSNHCSKKRKRFDGRS